MTDPAAALRALEGAPQAPQDAPPASGAPEPERRRPGRPKGSKTRNRAAPAAPAEDPAAQAADQAAAEREAAQAAQAARVRDQLSGAMRDEFAAALGELYALPFQVAAALTDIPGMAPSPTATAARGKLCLLVVECYGGNWVRHLPAIMLGAAFAADAGLCVKLYQDARKARQGAGAGPAPSAPAPAARAIQAPAPTAQAPPGAPPPVTA